MWRDPNYPRLEDHQGNSPQTSGLTARDGSGLGVALFVHLIGLAVLGIAVAGIQQHYLGATRGVVGFFGPDSWLTGKPDAVWSFRLSLFPFVLIIYAALTAVRMYASSRAARGSRYTPVYVLTGVRHLVVAEAAALALLAPHFSTVRAGSWWFPPFIELIDPPEWVPSFFVYPLPLALLILFLAVMTHNSAKRSLARANSILEEKGDTG
ncbi:hypothetical protein [Actinokineospora sp. NPDC004072]